MRLHIHFHREVQRGSVWVYLECRCGHRTARRTGNPRPFPVDQGWLDGGEFAKPPTEPPPKPEDAGRSASPNAARLAAGLMPAPPATSWHGRPGDGWCMLAPGWIGISPEQQELIEEALARLGTSLAEVLEDGAPDHSDAPEGPVQPAPPPEGVPLDKTTPPVHYEGDTSSV